MKWELILILLYCIFQSGQQFLDKNLTEWKKPILMDHFEDGKAEENNKEENNKDGHDNDNNVDGDKPNAKLPQHNTMVGTAKVCT